MTPVVVLAFDGEFDAARAVAALAAAQRADVATLTLDIGQSRDVQEARDTALAAGAVRAHVVDALDEFARRCVLPALQPSAGADLARSAAIAHPLIARHLVEIAKLEGARVVAHAGADDLSAAIQAIDPSLRIVTIEAAPPAGARRRSRLAGASRHLLQRPVADPGATRGVAATLEVAFEDAVPVAINGVPLSLPELLECLSLIAGQHGIGHADGSNLPGALVLETAYRSLGEPAGVVRIELLDGSQRVLAANVCHPELVNHA